MQLMTAVGRRHVRPTPNNTCPVNPPIKHNFGYPVGPVTKDASLANGTNHWRTMYLIV